MGWGWTVAILAIATAVAIIATAAIVAIIATAAAVAIIAIFTTIVAMIAVFCNRCNTHPGSGRGRIATPMGRSGLGDPSWVVGERKDWEGVHFAIWCLFLSPGSSNPPPKSSRPQRCFF